MIKDADFVKPEFKKLVRDEFHKHQNFFKHADKDPQKSLEFSPDDNEGVICEACIKYCELAGEGIPSFHVFLLWERLWRPERFVAPDARTLQLTEEMKQLVNQDMRREYYARMLEVSTKV